MSCGYALLQQAVGTEQRRVAPEAGPTKEQAYIDFAFWGTGEDVREGKLDNVWGLVEEGVTAFKVYMTPSVPTLRRQPRRGSRAGAPVQRENQ
ncbi:hypothetical protein GCM10011571_34290 [Marinithermofilum abyssi]|uniref:Uncharacterized protein n=1 Tax=Marinithermofilum abyssi TaxID=1571185 RepID=A0A8J2YBY6_9BACL|nr:hypothetical protein [Marinithermofilum abyssi]GGE29307.1 hypothetical protein GCM10011571_34290 [Marinithermofilum abyssi]